jgi:pimeloyl-ACP methyl ester carboxylesterase
VIRFDKPNTGLSDRPAGAGSLQDRIDDLWALLEAVGAEHPALVGISVGGAIATLFAATYAERTARLVLCAAAAFWGDERQVAELFRLADRHWGTGGFIEYLAPALAAGPSARESVARYERSAARPAAARAIFEEGASFDMRPLLGALRVPTMVIQSTGDRLVDARHGRYLASHIRARRWTSASWSSAR